MLTADNNKQNLSAHDCNAHSSFRVFSRLKVYKFKDWSFNNVKIFMLQSVLVGEHALPEHCKLCGVVIVVYASCAYYIVISDVKTSYRKS